MKQVQSAAWGYPERAYAKWVVLNFAWGLIGKDLDTSDFEKRFRYACETKTELSHLQIALGDIFKAALKFYRSKRGKGEKARDVSTFFQLTNLDDDFRRFWNSKANSYRGKVEHNIEKFRQDLKGLELED
jgi:hypothetical protein